MLLLRDSNCLSIGMGVESGSNKMLKAMKKGITREQSLRTLRDASEVGLHLKIQLMGGYPGETRETLAETASLMKEAGLPPRRLTWLTPLPGSELYEDARSQGLIEDEEAYVLKLHKGYNNSKNVVLNVSGHSDEEMIRLFNWVHMKMDIDYFIMMLKRGRVFEPVFRRHLKRTLDMVIIYYAPFLVKVRDSFRQSQVLL